MSWYYERGGESVGPVSEDEFSRLVAAGSIAPATLVWREGMANWLAHSELQSPPATGAPPIAAAVAAVPGAANATCQVCGGVFPADHVVIIAGAPVCAACKPMRLQMLQEGSSVVGAGLWRSGKSLVAAKDARLPDRCVQCGGTSDLHRIKKKLYWHHPAIFLTILAGLLIYVIVALVTRKRADIEFSICAADRTRRRIKIAIAWLLFIAVLVSFVLLGVYNAPEWTLLLPPVLLIAAVVVALLARLVYAGKIDEKHLWVRGICAGFLADLPQWPGK